MSNFSPDTFSPAPRDWPLKQFGQQPPPPPPFQQIPQAFQQQWQRPASQESGPKSTLIAAAVILTFFIFAIGGSTVAIAYFVQSHKQNYVTVSSFINRTSTTVPDRESVNNFDSPTISRSPQIMKYENPRSASTSEVLVNVLGYASTYNDPSNPNKSHPIVRVVAVDATVTNISSSPIDFSPAGYSLMHTNSKDFAYAAVVGGSLTKTLVLAPGETTAGQLYFVVTALDSVASLRIPDDAAQTLVTIDLR